MCALSRSVLIVGATALIVVSLVACSRLTMTPTAVVVTATVTASPTPTVTTVASPTATRYYPPRPTVTLSAASPTPQHGVFSQPDYGLTLPYPVGWHVLPPDEEAAVNEGVLAWFVSSEATVIGTLVDMGLLSDQLAYVAPAEHREYLKSVFGQDFQVLRDEKVLLTDGRTAWTTLSEGTFKMKEIPRPVKLKIHLLSAAYGGRYFLLILMVPAKEYDSLAAEIQTFLLGLHLEPAQWHGIPRNQVLILPGWETTNQRYYDPATTSDSGDKLLFSGLVAFDPNLKLVPDLAETWVSDGQVYTFTLRSNARFHNGRPVTAADVIYSWERAADPATDSDTVLTYLGDIVGVADKHAGRADHIAGLSAPDEHTLVVRLDAPKPYFLMKLTYPVTFVVDRENVAAGPEWYRTPNGTGPYRLVRWDSFSLKLYERNDDYYFDPPAIPYVAELLNSGEEVRLYESGQVDFAYVGGAYVNRFLNKGDKLQREFHSAMSMCTSFVAFDNTQPPFDDVRVRQAFSVAFDRQRYLDLIFHNHALPAVGLYPPALPGYNAHVSGWEYDPQRARELLAASRYGAPENLPPIVFTAAGYGTYTSSGVSALVQMWQNTLGITITVENLEPDKFHDEINAGHHGQLFEDSWCADYPDPENFADVLFHSASQYNHSHYRNTQVDAWLEEARVATDVTQRLKLYQMAEQQIIADAPVIFVSHGRSYFLLRPYVKGFQFTPIAIAIERYLSLEME